MAVTTYDYLLSKFPNDKVAPYTLKEQVEDPDSGIVTQLESLPLVTVVGGVPTCLITFKAELSSGEESALDTVVANHYGVSSGEPDQTEVISEDGTVWTQPQTSCGTPLSNPNILPPGYLLYIAGAFDDLNEEKRGEGEQMGMEQDGVGQNTIEGQFLEHVYALGGSLCELDAGFGDWATMEVYAPASSPAVASGDGNANAVSTGLGFDIYVPAPGGDGDRNVDGSTLLAGEINEDLAPVPNRAGQGYWNWDPDQDPSIMPVTDPESPDGDYDLYSASFPLVRQAARVPLMNNRGECCPPTIKGKKLLPHWRLKFTINRASVGKLSAAFYMKLARKNTV